MENSDTKNSLENYEKTVKDIDITFSGILEEIKALEINLPIFINNVRENMAGVRFLREMTKKGLRRVRRAERIVKKIDEQIILLHNERKMIHETKERKESIKRERVYAERKKTYLKDKRNLTSDIKSLCHKTDLIAARLNLHIGGNKNMGNVIKDLMELKMNSPFLEKEISKYSSKKELLKIILGFMNPPKK